MRRLLAWTTVVVALLVVGLLFLNGFIYREGRIHLDAALGDQLIMVGRLMARAVGPDKLAPLAAGDSLTKAAIDAAVVATVGKLDVANVMVFDTKLNPVYSWRRLIPGAEEYMQLVEDRIVLKALGGQSVHRVPYDTERGVHKAAYVPVIDPERNVAALVAIEAGPRFLQPLAVLSRSYRRLDLAGIIIGAVLVLVFWSVGLYLSILHRHDFRRRAMMAFGKLASSLSRELHEPLDAFRTDLAELKEPGLRRRFEAQLEHWSGTIDKYLDLDGRAVTRLVPTDVHELLESTLDQVRANLERNHIRIVKNLQAQRHELVLDRESLARAFTHILLNAVQAMPGGGDVQITTQEGLVRNRSHLLLEFRDHGPGIARKHLRHVFDPFYTTRPGQSGLGLFVVRKVAREHHGFVDVRSARGRGTKVRFGLPLES